MQDVLPGIRGRVRSLFVPDGSLPGTGRLRTPWSKNLVLRQWGAIVGNLLAQGDSSYKINSMYLEFANVVAPNTPAPVPDFDRNFTSAAAYYAALTGNDYLRVPMIAATLSSSDPVLFPDGNLLTFFAQTSGVVGVHGKPFGVSYNSVVIGGALVAQRVPADATQDLVLSRFYFSVEAQQPKLATGQVGVEWELTLQ